MALWPEEIDTPYNGLLQDDGAFNKYVVHRSKQTAGCASEN